MCVCDVCFPYDGDESGQLSGSGAKGFLFGQRSDETVSFGALRLTFETPRTVLQRRWFEVSGWLVGSIVEMSKNAHLLPLRKRWTPVKTQLTAKWEQGNIRLAEVGLFAKILRSCELAPVIGCPLNCWRHVTGQRQCQKWGSATSDVKGWACFLEFSYRCCQKWRGLWWLVSDVALSVELSDKRCQKWDVRKGMRINYETFEFEEVWDKWSQAWIV